MKYMKKKTKKGKIKYVAPAIKQETIPVESAIKVTVCKD